MKRVVVVRRPPLPDLTTLDADVYEVVEGDAVAVVCVRSSALPDRESWTVDERPQWRDAEPDLVRFSFVRRLPSLDRPAFARHWTDVHAPLARVSHPALVSYVQNVVIDGPDATDGIAELGLRDGAPMYASEEDRKAVAGDIATFLDVAAGWRLLTRPLRTASRP